MRSIARKLSVVGNNYLHFAKNVCNLTGTINDNSTYQIVHERVKKYKQTKVLAA